MLESSGDDAAVLGVVLGGVAPTDAGLGVGRGGKGGGLFPSDECGLLGDGGGGGKLRSVGLPVFPGAERPAADDNQPGL